jgi:glucose/arabinose dehydrogenase
LFDDYSSTGLNRRDAVLKRPKNVIASLTVCLGLFFASGCNNLGALLGGLGGGTPGVGGPIGIILSILDAIPPPPDPFEAEYNVPPFAVAEFKIILTPPFAPDPKLNGTLLRNITAEPVSGALGPDGFIYYTEKASGRVRRLDPETGALDGPPVIDLPVNHSGRRGLNGIAFSPDGTMMFLTYVRSSTGADTGVETEALESRVSAFPFPSPTPGDEMVLFTAPPRDPNFALYGGFIVPDINGMGTCKVGPDGKLFFSHGDWNTRLPALDGHPANPAGKIHRINFDGSVPDDNPLGPDNSIFALGLRDPFGFNFDREEETMWIADRGSGRNDELNRGAPGANYGWPLLHGSPNTDFEQSAATLLFFLLTGPVIDFAGIYPRPNPTSLEIIRGMPYGEDLEGDLLYAHFEMVQPFPFTEGQPQSKVGRIRYRVNEFFVHWNDVWWAPPEAGRVVGLVARTDGRIIALCQNQIYRLDPLE